jgi:aspartate beta-hydroxylase
MFIVKAYGVAVPENVKKIPTLARLLDECPEVKSATISFLAPRKHIPRHRGPFRGVMRFHLGLKIPREPSGRPATIMMIDDREYRITDGECLLWDDTFPHEVMNNADEPRIALLLDVWRPRMPVDMEILSQVIVGAVQLGMRYRGVTYAADPSVQPPVQAGRGRLHQHGSVGNGSAMSQSILKPKRPSGRI